MAGQLCWATSGEVTMVSNTAKTILQIKAATNQRVLIRKIRLLGKQAAGGTDAVAKVRWTTSTANFGTGTSVTPIKNNASNGETVQTAAAKDFTVEPTTPTDSLNMWEFNPQSGIIEDFAPGTELQIPGGQSGQLEVTVTGTPVLIATILFEE